MGLRASRIYYFFVLSLLLSGAAILLRPHFRQAVSSSVLPAQIKNPAEQSTSSIQSLLNLPENKIDIGIAALTLAREIYPDVDVASYSAKLDSIAGHVRRLAKGTHDPDQRIRCLNTVILLHEKFQGTRDLSIARKSEKYFLNRVLDSKRGNCFSMPVLYVAVAQRLGWPIYPVSVPDHSFVRYVDPVLKEQNIETTSNGGYVPNEQYVKDFMVSSKGRKSGAYLRTLTYREFLGDLVATNGIRFGQQGQLAKAAAYLQLATQLNPKLVGAWANLVNVNRMIAKRSSGPEAKKYLEAAAKYSKKLNELGFVHPKDVPQFVSAGRPQ